MFLGLGLDVCDSAVVRQLGNDIIIDDEFRGREVADAPADLRPRGILIVEAIRHVDRQDAAAIGPRLNLDGVLSVDVTFGLDYQDTAWAEVRRGVGHLAAAELVVDDDVLSAIPDNGSIGSVQTEAEEHLNAALDRYLGQFLQVGMA